MFDIRPADPRDCAFLAEMAYASMLPVVGHGLFDRALDGLPVTPLGFLEALIATGANHWGQLASFLVLTAAGEPAGAAGAFCSSDPDWRPLTPAGFEAVSATLDWSPADAKLFWRRYLLSFGIAPTPPVLAQPASYVIEYISIRPAYRGRGGAGRLLAGHVARARLQGHRSIGVSAVIGNDRPIDPTAASALSCRTASGPSNMAAAFPVWTGLSCGSIEAVTARCAPSFVKQSF